MDIEIIDFLKTSASPEIADTYQKSFDLFDKFNVEDYILPYDEIYAMVDDFDLTYIQNRLDNTLDNMLRYLLNQHGIVMNDNASMEFMNEILEGILAIDEYEDYSTILTILDNDETNVEKLAEILSLITNCNPDDIIINIDVMSPGLIKRIKEIFNNRQALLTEYSNSDSANIKAKAAWIKQLFSLTTQEFKDCKTSVLYPKLEEGLKFNLEFKFYTDLLWTEVSELSNPEIARDLVGMIIVSSDKSEKVLETIKEFIGTYISDIDQIGRITDFATRQFLVSKQDNGVTNVK